MSRDDNPYQAPAAALSDHAAALDITPVGKWRRFFNWLIDRLAIYGVAMTAMVGAALIDERVLLWAEDIDTVTDFAITYAITFFYYTLLEGLFGFSIGKLVTDTRVVNEAGLRLSFGRAALRSLCRLIPFNAFSVLLSDDDRPRGWHDSLSRSHVVRRRKAGVLAMAA